MRWPGLLGAVSLLLLYSCSKDGDSPQAPSLLLRQLSFVHINTSSSLPPSPAQADFSYDASRRVTRILIYRGDSGQLISPLDTLSVTDFSYTGNAPLPILADLRNRIGSGPLSRHWHFLSYDNIGRLLTDSVTGATGTNLFRYRYQDNYIISESGPGANNLITIDSQIVLNGNLVSFYLPATAGNTTQYRYEYDFRENPFNRMNIAPLLRSASMAPGNPFHNNLETLLPFWGANNAGSIFHYNNGVLTRTHTLFYQYNGDGLPIQRIWSFNNPVTVADTVYFKY